MLSLVEHEIVFYNLMARLFVKANSCILITFLYYYHKLVDSIVIMKKNHREYQHFGSFFLQSFIKNIAHLIK